MITHEDTNYRIFISTDSMDCFICRKGGHVAKNCPNIRQSPITLNNSEGTTNEETVPEIISTHQTNENIDQQNEEFEENQNTIITQIHTEIWQGECGGNKKRPLFPSCSKDTSQVTYKSPPNTFDIRKTRGHNGGPQIYR
ncbi:hypothetical protein HHI36_003056 [Cryptolaemus montrouzieri]|uniref:CCHC-type domain-containing protein n=1 Tax=Cryptolaemus montrouzieri TaxID=559131 RepID=A0ABD2PCC1_9CUCU